MDNLAQFESDLWEAADNLRANSKLTSSDYFMPVLGVIFLHHAANRFEAATRQIEDDQAAGRLPRRITEAMTAIEAAFEPLQGVLPKDYGIFETKVFEDLMRLFNSVQIKQATGDVFGRIYEYFLAKFSIQKAHDNGE